MIRIQRDFGLHDEAEYLSPSSTPSSLAEPWLEQNVFSLNNTKSKFLHNSLSQSGVYSLHDIIIHNCRNRLKTRFINAVPLKKYYLFCCVLEL